jgi:hypothetical protein
VKVLSTWQRLQLLRYETESLGRYFESYEWFNSGSFAAVMSRLLKLNVSFLMKRKGEECGTNNYLKGVRDHLKIG